MRASRSAIVENILGIQTKEKNNRGLRIGVDGLRRAILTPKYISETIAITEKISESDVNFIM
ncbi:hypothetical protein CVD28_11850 [Bacillus sp. M6-12]|uniref:hypothetical protein n=1 Tax=Bacillus sp. M6-12 TaxID=2054166 RepID=UPI000C76F433|nr:hypothetical protein [Bacillus sp. M6-12]PLS17257.1 hypothetical protein CVD28_11850 [Bacillus sp. M6-12]